MCRRDQSSCWLLALLLLVLFFSARTIWADETVLPSSGPAGSSESMTPELLPLSGSATLIETWPDYDSASASFLSALDQLALSWPKYSRLQVSLGISFLDFPEYIDGLIAQSEASEAALMTERQAAVEREAGIVERLWAAERSRAAWRTGALIGISAAALEAVIIIMFVIAGG